MKLPKAVFFTLLFYMLVELLGFWILLIPDDLTYLGLIRVSHLINSIVLLISLLVLFKLIKKPDALKFEKPIPKYYLISILIGIGFVFFQSVLQVFYYQEISKEIFTYSFSFERLKSLNVIASILIVPVTEEIFFRNFILRGLLQKYKPILAILISSFLFAFIHISFVPLFYEFLEFSIRQAYIAIFGGIIAGILFHKSKSIIPPIIFHATWNLVSYVF